MHFVGHPPDRRDAAKLDDEALGRFSSEIASLSHRGHRRQHLLLSATLPERSNVRSVAPLAISAEIAIEVRQHVAAVFGRTTMNASAQMLGRVDYLRNGIGLFVHVDQRDGLRRAS